MAGGAAGDAAVAGGGHGVAAPWLSARVPNLLPTNFYVNVQRVSQRAQYFHSNLFCRIRELVTDKFCVVLEVQNSGQGLTTLQE
jgi:hypothetical protein